MTPIESKGPWFGVRHLQAFLLFLYISVIYISRLNVAVAVVAMTNAATSNPDFPEYDWNQKHKSYIISSFFWGYLFTQFAGSYWERRFGCKIVLFTSTFISSILSLITPFCVSWGSWQVFCLIRILQGIIQGGFLPCIHAHLANWSPINERNRLGSLSHTGFSSGVVLSMAISGIIAEGPMGWPGIFYISAATGFGWCVLWLIFGANNAQTSRFCTKEERNYIETSLQRTDGFHQKKISIPWRAIFTSVPFYAFLITRCVDSWGFFTIQAELPSYMHGVLKMNIKENALYSALPYLGMWILGIVCLIIADFIMNRGWSSLTTLRKTFNTIGFWIPAAGLIGFGFVEENQKTLAIALITITFSLNSTVTIGSVLNGIDLSPNHVGILMGISNSFCHFTVFLSTLMVGFIIDDETDRTQWQIVFLIIALVLFFGNLVFLIWGSTDQQPWNDANYILSKDKKMREDKLKSNVETPLLMTGIELKPLEK